jgi:hypothetical protein
MWEDLGLFIGGGVAVFSTLASLVIFVFSIGMLRTIKKQEETQAHEPLHWKSTMTISQGLLLILLLPLVFFFTKAIFGF